MCEKVTYSHYFSKHGVLFPSLFTRKWKWQAVVGNLPYSPKPDSPKLRLGLGLRFRRIGTGPLEIVDKTTTVPWLYRRCAWLWTRRVILTTVWGKCWEKLNFYPRDAIVTATCLSVRPSVCPSRAGIVSKRRKLAAWFLHHLVALRL